MARIIVTIEKDGSTIVAVEGVKGSACYEFSKKIEAALGARVSDTETPELHEEQEATEKVKVTQ